MTDATPNPKALDLGAFLAGQDYPTDEVEVFTSEKIMYELNKAGQALKRAEILEDADAIREIESKRDELIAAGLDSRLVVHLQGIPKKTDRDIQAKALSEHPLETDFLGRPQLNVPYRELLTELYWAAYIVKIEAPDGSALVAPSIEDIRTFRGLAPEAAQAVIEQAIDAFTTGSKSGFETLVQEHGFLSQPSPEA